MPHEVFPHTDTPIVIFSATGNKGCDFHMGNIRPRTHHFFAAIVFQFSILSLLFSKCMETNQTRLDFCLVSKHPRFVFFFFREKYHANISIGLRRTITFP